MILLTLATTIHALKPSPCELGSLQCSTPSKLQFAVLCTALALASLGIGGTRFTIATMGADQFHKPKDQGIFFNWYYLALYVATCISMTAIIYIQDNLSWGLSFGICLVVNAIALILFSSGKRFYRRIKPDGSPFVSIFRVAFAAIQKRNVPNTFGNQDYNYRSGETKNILQDGPSKSFRYAILLSFFFFCPKQSLLFNILQISMYYFFLKKKNRIPTFEIFLSLNILLIPNSNRDRYHCSNLSKKYLGDNCLMAID